MENRLPENNFTVIAHRGASGYLPENTLEAAALAHSMGAHFIEMDVVLTHDNVPVVFHDLYLDELTCCSDSLPKRQRKDGRHYLIDYNWEEIRKFIVRPRTWANGKVSCPQVSSAAVSGCRIPTLNRMVELIRRLNGESGRNVGLYIEPKEPGFHEAAGMDVLEAVIQELKTHQAPRRSLPVFIQSFDLATLKKARVLKNEYLKLVALFEEGTDSLTQTDSQFFSGIVGVVDGVGLPISRILFLENEEVMENSGLIEEAHNNKLFVHVWHTLENRLPKPFPDMNRAVRRLKALGVDGVFTDHPDRVLQFSGE